MLARCWWPRRPARMFPRRAAAPASADSIAAPSLTCGGSWTSGWQGERLCPTLSLKRYTRRRACASERALSHLRAHIAPFPQVPGTLQARKDGAPPAMAEVTAQLEALGYTWAARVLKYGSWVGPTARRRVFVIASYYSDACHLLFRCMRPCDGRACGHGRCFECFEANMAASSRRGVVDGATLGDQAYVVDMASKTGYPMLARAPTLRSGNRDLMVLLPDLGADDADPDAAAPAGQAVMLTMEDKEALSGFPVGWTEGRTVDGRPLPVAVRQQALANSACPATFQWLGDQLATPCEERWDPAGFEAFDLVGATGDTWPNTTWGGPGRCGQGIRTGVSEAPARVAVEDLPTFLSHLPHERAPPTLAQVGSYVRRATGPTSLIAPRRIGALLHLVTSRTAQGPATQGNLGDMELGQGLPSKRRPFCPTTPPAPALTNAGSSLIGTQLSVLFRQRAAPYVGVVTAYDANSKRHRVVFEDLEKHDMVLDKQEVQLVPRPTGPSMVGRNILVPCPAGSPSAVWRRAAVVAAAGEGRWNIAFAGCAGQGSVVSVEACVLDGCMFLPANVDER